MHFTNFALGFLPLALLTASYPVTSSSKLLDVSQVTGLQHLAAYLKSHSGSSPALTKRADDSSASRLTIEFPGEENATDSTIAKRADDSS
ncbi:uncharacterized protein N7483_006395 [Penicillium malachiteum]|uniref:uncharacterized protein n=1 Tax=Penicillium malachiteum TaxID=1324776 RepID=UPI00254907E5|nr:uncharacterized protein N7483_006395 [Penicillium malachiteum]KAJ5725038.1 hypothetical protein N7483_006395 [Penicillium malachiteum]